MCCSSVRGKASLTTPGKRATCSPVSGLCVVATPDLETTRTIPVAADPIHLTTAGFYDGAKEFSAAGQKELVLQDAR